MNTIFLFSGRFIASFAASALFAQSALYAASVSSQDQELANKLSQGNITEVQIGKMVKSQATDPAVKDFADRMVRDHSQMKDQLQHWASLNGVMLKASASQDGQDLKGRLANASGKKYDQEYIKAMLDDHKKDVAELQNFLSAHPESSLKPLVSQALPIMENHIRVAENVAGKLGLPPDAGLNRPEHPKS